MRADLELRAKLLGDVRSPKAANMRTSYTQNGQRQVAEWNADTAVKVAYYQNIISARCANIVAEDLASVPLRAGKTAENPKDYNLNARILELLGEEGSPNPNTDSHELLVWSIINFMVTGRYGWELELTPNRAKDIVAIWPLIPNMLQPLPVENQSNLFSGYEYVYGAEVKQLRLDQVFYHWRPSLHDWRQPESVLQAARYDLSVAIMQDRYDYNFLLNDARPAAVGVTERFAKREEYEAFKRQWQGQYGGPDNSGKMAWIEADPDETGNVSGMLDIKTLGLSQKDAEFIKRHEQKMRNVAIAYGVPWSRLDASGRTFDNADVEDKTYWKSSIMPLAKRFSKAFNRGLAPRFGSEKTWFDFSMIEALKDNRRYQQTRLVDLYNAGVLTKDETRAVVDEPATTDGESFIAAPAPSPTPVQIAASKQPKIRLKSQAETRSFVSRETRRSLVRTKTNQVVNSKTLIWRARFDKLFTKQQKATLDRLTGKRGRQALEKRAPNADAIFDPEFWKRETQDMTEGMYQDVFEIGATRIVNGFGVAFDVEAPYVHEKVLAQTNRLAGQVTDTTYDSIKAALSDGIAEGEGIPELSERVRHVFSVASESRAEMIARTEVLGAYNDGAVTFAKELGPDIVAGKEWIGDGDNDACSGYSSAGPIGINETWGGADAPPIHPRCRCSVGFLTREEMGLERSRKSSDKRIRLEKAEAMMVKAAMEAA